MTEEVKDGGVARPQKGSLAWWVLQAARHTEDMGEEGILVDRDHWLTILTQARMAARKDHGHE